MLRVCQEAQPVALLPLGVDFVLPGIATGAL